MIAKANSISYGKNGIDYAISREEALILDKQNIVGSTGTEIKAEFKRFQDLNGRCKRNEISFVLSPEPKDGKKLTDADMRDIGVDFLKKMNLENHQAIIVQHTDKEHKHLHIYANRIDMNGNAYKDNFISKKSQAIAEEIAKERNLTRAKDVQAMNKELTKEFRKEIFRRHKIALEHHPKNFEEYTELMKSNKIDIIPTINKGGKMQGFKVSFQSQTIKASAVNRAMSYNKVIKEISKNEEKKIFNSRHSRGFSR